MSTEKWVIHPGETRVIDIDAARKIKIGLVGGQIDVIAHDEPGIRIEVHAVAGKDLRIDTSEGVVDIDHAQLGWSNVFEVFRNLTSSAPSAELSVAVPRSIALALGSVSATSLVSGLEHDASLNTASGDIVIDRLVGDLSVNTASGDVQVRGLVGAFNANSASGDVAVTGSLRKVSIDTVSGSVLVDAEGAVSQIALNTVSADATIRLDEGYPVNYTMRTVTGRLRIDGETYPGSPRTGIDGSVGELTGMFVDVRAKSVSGDVTVVRRGVVEASDADAAPAVVDAAPGDAAPSSPPSEADLLADPAPAGAPLSPGVPDAPTPPDAPSPPGAPTPPEAPAPLDAPAPPLPPEGVTPPVAPATDADGETSR